LRVGDPPYRQEEWISVELEQNTTTGVINLYVFTQDGTLSGLYTTQNMETGGTWSFVDIIGGYFGSGGTNNIGNYFIIDELAIDNKYIGPPVGFSDNNSPSLPPPDPSPEPPSAHASDATFAWNKNQESVIGYKLYYKIGGDPIEPFNGTGLSEGNSPIIVGDVNSYTITGLDPEETYHFTLTAYDAKGESDYSDIVTINPIPIPVIIDIRKQ
jgi:hypothetical protein